MATRSLPFPSILQTSEQPFVMRPESGGDAENGRVHGCCESWIVPSRAPASHFLTWHRSSDIRVSFAPFFCSAAVSGRTFSALKPCDHEAIEKATAVCRFTDSFDEGRTSL